MSYDPIDFDDLQPVTIPVKIAGKQYELREATGDVACKFRNALMKTAKMGSDFKVTSVEGLADIEPLLVSMCLVLVTDNGFKPVTTADVRAWPNRVQKALFDRIKTISDLDEREQKESLKERAKNELSATMDGSV